MKLVQQNVDSINIVAADDLVLQHHGVSSHRAQYTSMHFQLFKG